MFTRFKVFHYLFFCRKQSDVCPLEAKSLCPITDVLFQKGQFQGISSWLYSGIVPDEETKAVVKEVFSAESTSHEATFYYNPALSEYESVMWFEYSGDVEFVFEHTETNWGIEYTTRFFV